MKKQNIRQLRAIQLLSEGYSKRQALLRAGYSKSSANQASRILRTQSMRRVTENMLDKIQDSGITIDFVAHKIAEWMNAQKLVNGKKVNDFPIQIKAFDIYMTIIKEQEKGENKKGKPTLSIAKWIRSD